MEQAGLIVASVSLLFWVGVLILRGGFWRADQRLTDPTPDLNPWPGVVCVIPARNEAHNIARCVGSLLASDYPDFEVIVVDDHITGVMSEHMAGRALDVPPSGIRVNAEYRPGWWWA